MKRLPSFIVAGAMKGGTSSTRANISFNNHNEVFIPNKNTKAKSIENLLETNDKAKQYYKDIEPNVSGEIDYFCKDELYELGEDYYKAFFDTDKKIVGDVSPNYMYLNENANTHKRIKQLIPDCKIIFLLRDPIRRAFSHWNHLIQIKPEWSGGIEEDTFYESITKFPESGNAICDRGLYSNNIKQYIDVFGRENIMIVQQEQMKIDTFETLNKIIQFAGAQAPLNKKRVLYVHERTYEATLDDKSKQFLQGFYREEVQELKKLFPELNYKLWNKY